MTLFQDISKFLAKYIHISDSTIILFLYSITAYIVIKIGVKIILLFINKYNKSEKKIYELNKKIKVFGTVLTIFILFLIWENNIKNVITLISFISAAVTLSLKDFVFNYFSGIYLRISKLFKVEDRIEISGIIGDVVNINYLNFELLEINNKEAGEQSTGIIVQIPCSKIFTENIKNYGKAFKYIWHELNVRVSLDSDIQKTKKILFNILTSNEIIASIPPKMQEQLDNAITDYRIYYNNLNPIIYMSIKDNYIEFSLRYLMHPKKNRNVENDLWEKILLQSKKGKISLFTS